MLLNLKNKKNNFSTIICLYSSNIPQFPSYSLDVHMKRWTYNLHKHFANNDKYFFKFNQVYIDLSLSNLFISLLYLNSLFVVYYISYYA